MAGAARDWCAAQTIWEMVQRSPELQKLCEEIMEESKDDWEAKLHELGMDKNNVIAVLASLNAKARDRGYARHTTDVSVAGTVEHRHLHMHKSGGPLQDMSDEELKARIAERRAQLALENRPEVPMPKPKLIEGEMKDVTPGPA